MNGRWSKGNWDCNGDGKERKLLFSWKSSNWSESARHGHDFSKYATNLETYWEGDIQRVIYELVPHVIRYGWVL